MVVDTFGAIEYFVTHVAAVEDAGNGMVRVIRGIERNRQVIPVFSYVTPAPRMLVVGSLLREFAERMLREKRETACH